MQWKTWLAAAQAAMIGTVGALLTTTAVAGKLETIARDPYVGAIVIDASTGEVLFQDQSGAKGYPASVLKLMDLLIILEKIQAGALHLEDKVHVTAEASQIGGSQVFLKEHEEFSVDDLLYALMVQSANDAATALALHSAGTKEAFVEWMNQKAQALGMKATVFHSIHGLPPGADQQPDLTTARDLARLALAVLAYPDTLRYTATRERGFRNDKFTMRNHNHLLESFDGCDGLKTGYYRAAGYSIVATAQRGDVRVIAVVLGSTTKDIRDAKAKELLSKGLIQAAAARKAAAPPPAPMPATPPPTKP